MFTEDLAPYFATDGFGQAATLQGGATVNVIFDRAALTALGIHDASPRALARAIDVAETDVQKTLTIGSTAYTITRVDPWEDGACVMLELRL